ncbi:hypothetical protein M758_UG306400 [Ceratodon purpureus]|nr:hypothetical protein M758_UG306400 [Ceratodon purpureus]
MVSEVLPLSLYQRCCSLSTLVSPLANPDREISAAAQLLCSRPTLQMPTCSRPSRVLLKNTPSPTTKTYYERSPACCEGLLRVCICLLRGPATSAQLPAQRLSNINRRQQQTERKQTKASRAEVCRQKKGHEEFRFGLTVTYPRSDAKEKPSYKSRRGKLPLSEHLQKLLDINPASAPAHRGLNHRAQDYRDQDNRGQDHRGQDYQGQDHHHTALVSASVSPRLGQQILVSKNKEPSISNSTLRSDLLRGGFLSGYPCSSPLPARRSCGASGAQLQQVNNSPMSTALPPRQGASRRSHAPTPKHLEEAASTFSHGPQIRGKSQSSLLLNSLRHNMANAAFLSCFGPEEECIEVDPPTQNPNKLLAAKAKQKAPSAGASGAGSSSSTKRPRDKTTASTSTPVDSPPPPLQVNVPSQVIQRHLWLGYESMEKLALGRGCEPLFTDETIADRVTRGMLQAEGAEMEEVSISFPSVPQLLYPSTRRDGSAGQHFNLTQVPCDIPIDLITSLSLDFQI